MVSVHERLMRWAYTTLMSLVALSLPLVAFFNPKWRRWYLGRRHQVIPPFATDKPVVWMHVASLGEWEQGRPLLHALRSARPEYSYVITFFSPSGYERVYDWGEADWVGYLPLDTPGDARSFVRALAPKLVIWVKYDFWYWHWRAIREYGAPMVLIAAVFREHHTLDKGWARFIRREVISARQIAVQDAGSSRRLASWGYTNSIIAGDTRVDRVLEIAGTPWEDPVLQAFCARANVMIAGSVWPEDMDLLEAAMLNTELADWHWLIVPHDPTAFNPARWLHSFALYSQSDAGSVAAARVLLLDKVGVLKYVYRYGKAAYIGGGLGRGLHNTLEPAAYSVPVLFGPHFQKFPEAKGLVVAGGAFVVEESHQVAEILQRWKEDAFRHQAGEAAGAYVQKQSGATQKLLPLLTVHLDEIR